MYPSKTKTNLSYLWETPVRDLTEPFFGPAETTFISLKLCRNVCICINNLVFFCGLKQLNFLLQGKSKPPVPNRCSSLERPVVPDKKPMIRTHQHLSPQQHQQPQRGMPQYSSNKLVPQVPDFNKAAPDMSECSYGHLTIFIWLRQQRDLHLIT